MRIKILVPFAALMLAATLSAQDGKESKGMTEGRATATGKLECGTMTVNYGTPTWNEKFAADLKPGTVWRLGNNLPTSTTFDCGIKTAGGVVMPGEYMLALRYVDKAAANLLIYEGSTFYDESLPTWEIPGVLVNSPPGVKNLAINFVNEKSATNITVAFGPYLATIAIACVKAHPAVPTTFANVEAKFQVVALPVTGDVSDLRVGNVMIDRDGVTTKWGMFLTMKGDKASLAFKNGDAKVIAKDKQTVGGIVKTIKEMLAKDPSNKMMEQAASMFEKQLSTLEAREQGLARLAADKSIDTKPTKREKPASTLEFSTERPEGSIILKFGAQGNDASFEIKPREFMVRPKQG